MQSEKLRPYFLIILVVGALILTAFIFAPFLKPLALAAVFAVVLQGLYNRILRAFGHRASLASLATVLVSILVILLPLSLVSVLVATEASTLYASLEAGSGRNAIAQFFGQVDRVFGSIVPGVSDLTQSASTNVDTYTKDALQWVVAHAGSIFSSVTALLLALFIFFIALYYLLKDGKKVRQTLVELSPLKDGEDEAVLLRLERAVSSVIKGNLTIALIQGVLTTIGFALFGVPHAILWGTVTSVAALVPGIGTAIIFIPTVIFLFVTGTTISAIGLTAWGVLAVGLIDNLLGPKLIGRGMQLHPLLILLSVLGGLLFFGPSGVFLGPLTLSFLFALLTIYAEYSKSA